MTLAVLLALLAAEGEPHAQPSFATDAGFAVDAGLRGEVLDSTALDAGARDVEVSPRVFVHVEGAKVLPPEIYLDMLKLPDGVLPDAATALEVRRQTLEFLARSGYELASVAVRVTPAGIDLDIDEGQIERVLYLGQLSFAQIRFKLALALPNDVFNRPLLDAQVRDLSQAMGLTGVRWELIRTSAVSHVGPQVTQLPPQMDLALMGSSMIHERRPYEVHIIFPQVVSTGLGLEVRSGYLNGFEGGLSYAQRDLFFDGARARASTSGGGALRSRLDTEKLYFHFSRAALDLMYDFPLLAGRLRPGVWAQGELIARQRADLQLENFYAADVAGALQLQLELAKGFGFTLGGGFEWRRLFGFEARPGVPLSPDVLAADRKRPFLRISHESVIDPTVLRWERRHTFESELRFLFPFLGQPAFAWVDARYQYVHAFGWHDLWVNGRAHVAWGDVTFYDEVTVGEFVRGVFGDQWVPAAVNLQLEFRFSLTRDVLKIGIFNDLALIAVRPVRGESTLVAQLVEGFGPAVHFLANDMFQLDVYLTFGFRQRGFSVAPMIQLQKAF